MTSNNGGSERCCESFTPSFRRYSLLKQERQTCGRLCLFMSFRGLLPTLFRRPRPDPLRALMRGLGPRGATPPWGFPVGVVGPLYPKVDPLSEMISSSGPVTVQEEDVQLAAVQSQLCAVSV